MIKFLLRIIPLLVIVFFFNGCDQSRKTEDAAGFQRMLKNYWKDVYKLNPMDATMFGDYSYNDQFQNNCTKAYRDECKGFYKDRKSVV